MDWNIITALSRAFLALAALGVPWLAYVQFKKVLREKWIALIRDTGTQLAKNCDMLYEAWGRYCDFNGYSQALVASTEATQKISQDTRQNILGGLESEIRSANAKIGASLFHLKNLFKNDSPKVELLIQQVDALRKAAAPSKNNETLTPMPAEVYEAIKTGVFLSVNNLLHTEWKKVMHSWWRLPS